MSTIPKSSVKDLQWVRVYLKYSKLGHCTKASKSHSDKRVKRIFLGGKSQRILPGWACTELSVVQGSKGDLLWATFARKIACEQALHLGLTRDLFWARFIWVSREIWVRAARGLGRGRGKESLLAWLKNFHFHFAWAKRNPIGWKWHASINFRGECRNVLNRVPGGGNVWK